MTTYTRIGDYAVEDDMEIYTHAMNYKRKSYPLSDELKSQWEEGERKRENEFIICIFKPVEDDPNVDNKARLVAFALPTSINPKVEQIAKRIKTEINPKDVNKLLTTLNKLRHGIFKDEDAVNRFIDKTMNEFKQKYPHI